MTRPGLAFAALLAGCGSAVVLGPPQSGGGSAFVCPAHPDAERGTLTAACTVDTTVDEARFHVNGDHYPVPTVEQCPSGIHRIVVDDGVALVECRPVVPCDCPSCASCGGGG